MPCIFRQLVRANISGFTTDTPNTRDGVIWYKIKVELGEYYWMIDRRYSDFEALHKKLVDSQGLPSIAFPPKKYIGNKEPDFVEKRRKLLNDYLTSIVKLLGKNVPDDLAQFLSLHEYEVIFMNRKLAAEIFDKGEQILAQGAQYTFSPYQIWAINHRMKLAIPPLECGDKKQDMSHILDFCSKLETLNLVGSNISLPRSNICPNEYDINLSIFKSLKAMTLTLVKFDMIKELGNQRQTLEQLDIYNCEFNSVNQLLLCDSLYKNLEEAGPIYSFDKITCMNCNNNVFESIGDLGKLVNTLKYVEFEFDKLTDVFSLTSLPQLESVSYRGNIIKTPTDLHLRLGNIRHLDMSQNLIECLAPFQKLYSLQTLNLSSNLVAEVKQIKCVANLPCLESLLFTGNPVASAVDYRIKTFAYFGRRAEYIALDNERANSTELDQVAILQAIEIGKRSMLRSLS